MAVRLPVFTHRAAFMQRIADSVRAGYTHYTTGSLSVHKVADVARKFHDTYLVHLDAQARWRRKQQRLGNAVLYMLGRSDGSVEWVLLVTAPTAGDHPAHRLERLRDATTHRLALLNRFELVRAPRAAAAYLKPGHEAATARRPPAQPPLSWRYTADAHDRMRSHAIALVRRRADAQLDALIEFLAREPGFSLIRTAIAKCAVLVRAEWERAGRTAPPPTVRVPAFVRRIGNQGRTIPLPFWLKAHTTSCTA